MRNTLRSSRRKSRGGKKNLVNQSIQENISQNIQENTNLNIQENTKKRKNIKKRKNTENIQRVIHI